MNLLAKISLCIFLLAGILPMAHGLDLDEARNKKLVVELPTGFLEAKDASAKNLAIDINNKRRKAYEEVAKKTNTTVDIVGAQAHKKIKENLK